MDTTVADEPQTRAFLAAGEENRPSIEPISALARWIIRSRISGTTGPDKIATQNIAVSTMLQLKQGTLRIVR